MNILDRVYDSWKIHSKQMNSPDILMKICSQLDNHSLEQLSKTSLWLLIREFAQNQYFWYLRIQHLIGRELNYQSEENWKEDYYLLLEAFSEETPFIKKVLHNSLLVEMLLSLGYDPSLNRNYAIRYSSKNGYTEVVRLLLQDIRIDASSGGDYAIQMASYDGHIEVIRLLLEDGRADPSLAIASASAGGHIEVVELLLEDKRVDPSVNNNCSIKHAERFEHLDVVQLLEQDPRVIASGWKR